MKEEAKKQFQTIAIAQIKEILKKISPDKFDKMIISDNQSVKRGNYIFTKLKYEKVERQVEQIRFPLYGSIKDNFAELEGGELKFGEKSTVNSEKLFDSLKTIYKIVGQGFSVGKIPKPFVYPLDENNGEISKQQRKYFFSDHTYQQTCEDCRGDKYIKCTDRECDGRHNWTCTDCHGDGKVSCNDCHGDGKVSCRNCKGNGYVKCGSLIGSNLVAGIIGSSMAGCNGKGIIYIDGGKFASGQPRPKKQKQCGQCRGKGEIVCKDCGSRGEIKCDNCSGRGEVQCHQCSGKGDITCNVCYGDRERYGKVDCGECMTIGTIAQVVYVNSFVSENNVEKIILNGDKLNISDNNLQSHINKSTEGKLVYKKVNEKFEDNYDEYSKEYAEIFEKDLELNKNAFPLVTKEELFYQVIPCIELSYKHMITNTIHEFTIINIWDNPEIIFHSELETLKQSAGNVTKSVGGFFGKLFKTKDFKSKEDRRNEITLLIYLARADGKIEEEEKLSLSENIKHLDDFTNSEKQKLYDLMNLSTLPELTKLDVSFSSQERGQEVVSKLIELANSDGEIETTEIALIDKIKEMM